MENDKLTGFKLPDAFVKGNSDAESFKEVFLLEYQTSPTNFKNKVELGTNLFCFLLEGEKSVTYPGGKVSIDPGQFIMLSAGNCLMSEKKIGENGRFRSILLFFDNKALADFFIKYPLISKKTAGHLADEPFIVFNNDDFLENFVRSLGFILNSGPQVKKDLNGVKFEELMLYLSNKYPAETLALRTGSPQINEDLEIRSVVERHIESNVTVEELAFLCNNSLSTFKRRFAKIYGVPPHKWLLTKRMELAAVLLQNRESNASDVCYKVGYESLSSFIQSFKQVYGITPKKYQLRN